VRRKERERERREEEEIGFGNLPDIYGGKLNTSGGAKTWTAC